jgi:hypothetical protein
MTDFPLSSLPPMQSCCTEPDSPLERASSTLVPGSATSRCCIRRCLMPQTVTLEGIKKPERSGLGAIRQCGPRLST